jgi:hypothetical protein
MAIRSDEITNKNNDGAPDFPNGLTAGSSSFKWQRRNLVGDLSITTADIPSLRLSNLTIGRHYKITCSVFFTNLNIASAQAILTANHDGVEKLRLTSRLTSTTALAESSHSGSFIIKATATTVTFDLTRNNGGTLNDFNNNTFTLIEELPLHLDEVTDFT